MDEIRMNLLKEVADLDALPVGAYNIRENGKAAGRKTAAVITDMDAPLGHAIGNALEVREAIAALRGDYGGDLLALCLTLGSTVLRLGGLAESDEAAETMLRGAIEDGSALKKFADFVAAQGGDPRVAEDPSLLPVAPVQIELKAEKAGYIARMNAEAIGMVSLHLGGGRATKESSIDPAVGVVLAKKPGEFAAAGETLAVIHAADTASAQRAAAELLDCYVFSETPPERGTFIKGRVE